ncbi:hypothetical protein PN36_26860 [Candidatus Thiomargarita nelsonii]|uniref:Uncharacterized protein n=1 Tax=Candidatus Thiomargarita nelsonii TaxID=1003181 RepID=A0A0A6P7U4_9GAMM|nr:hypothetical protein PN36_26860 [Candidatus Thiomargarita nelsonii]
MLFLNVDTRCSSFFDLTLLLEFTFGLEEPAASPKLKLWTPTDFDVKIKKLEHRVIASVGCVLGTNKVIQSYTLWKRCVGRTLRSLNFRLVELSFEFSFWIVILRQYLALRLKTFICPLVVTHTVNCLSSNLPASKSLFFIIDNLTIQMLTFYSKKLRSRRVRQYHIVPEKYFSWSDTIAV